MANISKCKNCKKDVPKSSEILIDFETNRPYRLCSGECFNELMEKEALGDAEMQEWGSLYAKAIKLGEAESGRKFEDAGDGLIDSWIQKYACADEASVTKG